MAVDVFRDDRETARDAMVSHAGFRTSSDLRIARFSENVDIAHVHPGSEYHSSCLITSGAMFRVDRPLPAIRPGNVTLEPTWFEGQFTNDEVTDWTTVYIRETRLIEMAEQFSDTPAPSELIRSDGGPDPVLAALIRSCAGSLLSKHPPSQLELDGWAQIYGAHFLRHYSAAPIEIASSGGLGARALRIAIEAIEEDIEGDLSLASLARILDMGTTRLSSGFREATGQSIHQYVLARRVDRARELIDAGDMELADIAFAVGFSSQSHMTAVFRAQLGITPGKYRRDRK